MGTQLKTAHFCSLIKIIRDLTHLLRNDFLFSEFNLPLTFIFSYRVLLVHGHWFYVRTATLVQYFFYKNLAAFTAQLIYACFNSFSTQPVYDVINLTMFNILYTSIPIFVYGLFTLTESFYYVNHGLSIIM